MNDLTIPDIITFLTFLLGPRRAELDAIEVARPYGAVLDETLRELRELPPENLAGVPMAQQLEQTDGRHDAHGTALYFLALAVEASPLTSAEAKESARLIRERYVPGRNHLRASYASEAARAEERQRVLTEHQAVLDRIPVEGGTAHAWASAYVESGVELGMLLSQRADATGNRGDAIHLRGQALSDVRVLREVIARALRRTPDGGGAVDHRLFNYLDILAAMRASRDAGPTPPPPPDDPAPAV